MHINLSSELENFVYHEVKAGNFNSIDEAIAEGVNLLQRHSNFIKNIRNAVKEADNDFEAGNFITEEEFDEYFLKINNSI